jgi:hypothetical protein
MSDSDVNFTFVGSILWMISWLTVPAPTTGMPAVNVTCAPGATVADSDVSVTPDTALAVVPFTGTSARRTVHVAHPRNKPPPQRIRPKVRASHACATK